MKQLKPKPDKIRKQLLDKWTPHLQRSVPIDHLASWKASTVEGEDPEVDILGRKNISNVNYVFDLWGVAARKYPNVSLFVSCGKRPSRLDGFGLLDGDLEPFGLRFQYPGEGITMCPKPGKFDDVFQAFAERMPREERQIQIKRLKDRLHLATVEWELYQRFHHDAAHGKVDEHGGRLFLFHSEAFETEQTHIESMLKIYERIEKEYE